MIGLKDIARSGHVTRWHSVRVGRAQTIAEHHYLVTMLAQEMYRGIAKQDNPVQLLVLINYCLLHDTPELIMGDLPTPIKRRISQYCTENDYENPIDVIETGISPELAKLSDTIAETPLYYVAKLADIADAILFLQQEGIGDHAIMVQEKIELQFGQLINDAKKRFPDLHWQYANKVLNEVLNGRDSLLDYE